MTLPTATINVPGYRLVRPIGSGAAATVHVAMQRALERQVAVKVFEPTDIASVARFEQLLRTSARLSHPHIASIHQIGRTPAGHLFHSMPFLLSADLSRHNLRAKPLKVAALLRQVLDALAYAHRRGIVHGGIKPTNVLFDERGNVRLADFGIARCAAEMGRPHPRAAAYLSPEQARGNPPGQRSDLYSIGVMAFELLTGALPFEGEDAVATAVAHIEQPIPRLPPMVGAWQGWIDKALAKTPEQRFQSAAEMAAGLAALDGHSSNATTAPRAPRGRLPGWVIATGAIVVVIAAALGTWGTWRHAHRAEIPAAIAVQPAPVAAPAPANDPAPPAPATSSPLAVRVQVLLGQAEALRTHGHLFAPPGNNAAEQYLAVLMLDPGNNVAVDGIDAMLVTLHGRLDAAWRDNQFTQAGLLVKQCDLLARHAGPRASRTWRAQRAAFAKRVGDSVVAAAHDRDLKRLAALKPLAGDLPATYPPGFELTAAERAAATPVAGDKLRDSGGPTLVYAPAAGNAPAFAIARTEVTRANYAAFVQATHHPDTKCAEAYNPFSRLRHLTWQAPGFTQDGNDPAVCVSWNDATAYVAWLSKTTGKPYVLPDSNQWLRAAQGAPKGDACQLGNVDDASRGTGNDRWTCSDGAEYTAPVGRYAHSGIGAYDMYGNVSEWLSGGSSGSRPFRGVSWRDGNRQTPLGREGTAGTDIGYTNVGFRVLRVIDAAHPAPAAASH